MDRRQFCKLGYTGILSSTIIYNAAGAFESHSSNYAEPSALRKQDSIAPNILWICTDQQRYDTIGALGNKYIRTPNLDRLVKTGVAFNYAYCQSTICTPSRSSFLTGYYPRTVRGTKNGNLKWENAAPLITKILSDYGYDCGLAGKLHLASAKGRPEVRPDDGYRLFHSSLAPLFRPGESESNEYFDWMISKGHDPEKLYAKNGYYPTDLHQTTWCTDKAIDFITEKREGPWLFSLNYFDPHPPLDPPKEYIDRFDIDSIPLPGFQESDLEDNEKLKDVYFQSTCSEPKGNKSRLKLAKYWAQVELIDDNLGRILETLEDTGQRNNTLIIYTSDHGNMVGHHGLTAKGCRFYEGLVRVPLIMSWPDMFLQDLISDALVELVDITPTLLDIIGILPPNSGRPDVAMHGISLMDLLTGKSEPHVHREFTYSSYTKGLLNDESYGTMIRSKKYKLVNYHGSGWGQLFDMENDPGEFVNLWDKPEYQKIKYQLMEKSYDYTVKIIDTGSQYVARY
ncbi:Arylsulfatase [Limihaloglobus sulfuriphilus]|uniref:Arylsulfatase n=1 Tax=Limihaloglobus sulfuriphilus TaxID=1851148 RepID=A0A1Q2MCU0_9BACT|nr:sulfatase-like hydrolase/transferase [Limihaloglobus sulfuriphilus]AQQ70474.1 Arylsulfatase [Limihaloglobus sulfuriphilus]